MQLQSWLSSAPLQSKLTASVGGKQHSEPAHGESSPEDSSGNMQVWEEVVQCHMYS